LAWPSASGSWAGIKDGSGSSPNPDKDQPSTSPSLPVETAGERAHILVIEDNSADVLLIRRAIKGSHINAEIRVLTDGAQAIQAFEDYDANPSLPCPSLVILDINLPKKLGGEVLRHLRKAKSCSQALVIVVSTSDAQNDRDAMEGLGANAYFRKPSEFAEFMKLGDIVKSVLKRDA
jgi:DNA-binding response OmpR family regulator